MAPSRFAHPIFAGLSAHHALLAQEAWPTIDALNAAARARHGEHFTPRFVEQNQMLFSDGLHYETRIRDHGVVATRPANWHDLLNALIWIEYPELKHALNARQAEDVARFGTRGRTRGQCALTHFDEAGVIAVLREPERLAAWDRHDWFEFFRGETLWPRPPEVIVFGHALLEHALIEGQNVVGKTLVVVAAPEVTLAEVVTRFARAITRGEALCDPQELRPLPLWGLPGWQAMNANPDFYRTSPCFQPVRGDRRYPPPWVFDHEEVKA